MKNEVSTAIGELKHQFSASSVATRDDEQGGTYVVIDPIQLGATFDPHSTWLGFHIPAQYPYADIYPVFVGAEIRRANGTSFQVPITSGHNFEGRAAIQISRRSAAAQSASQKVVAKILKVLDFLEKLQ